MTIDPMTIGAFGVLAGIILKSLWDAAIRK